MNVNLVVTVVSVLPLIWIFYSFALMKKMEKIQSWLFTKSDRQLSICLTTISMLLILEINKKPEDDVFRL